MLAPRVSRWLTVAALLAAPAVARAQPAPAPAAAAKPVGSTLTQAEADEFTAYHNRVRKDVGVPAVEWSADLAKFAQQRAEEIAASGKFEHRPHQYGENLAMASGRGAEGVVKIGCDGWYAEKKDFTAGTPIPPLEEFANFKAGHYTQMVWKGTGKVGAGKAVVQTGPMKGAHVLVGVYDPKGNFVGEKPY